MITGCGCEAEAVTAVIEENLQTVCSLTTACWQMTV